MKDPLGLLGSEKIWYINGYYTNKVLEFESMKHFKAGEVSKTHILPYYIDGTGSVVYGRHLYFNRFVKILNQSQKFATFSIYRPIMWQYTITASSACDFENHFAGTVIYVSLKKY